MEKIIDIPFPELRKAIVALNESGLLASCDQERLKAVGVLNKIKLIAVSREAMLKQFMDAFDLIEDIDGKCPAPKEALDFYNKVIVLEEQVSRRVMEDNKEKKSVKNKKVSKDKKQPNKVENKLQEGSSRTIISNLVNSTKSTKQQIYTLAKEKGVKEKQVKMYLGAWEKGDRVPFGKAKLIEENNIVLFI